MYLKEQKSIVKTNKLNQNDIYVFLSGYPINV